MRRLTVIVADGACLLTPKDEKTFFQREPSLIIEDFLKFRTNIFIG